MLKFRLRTYFFENRILAAAKKNWKEKLNLWICIEGLKLSRSRYDIELPCDAQTYNCSALKQKRKQPFSLLGKASARFIICWMVIKISRIGPFINVLNHQITLTINAPLTLFPVADRACTHIIYLWHWFLKLRAYTHVYLPSFTEYTILCYFFVVQRYNIILAGYCWWFSV